MVVTYYLTMVQPMGWGGGSQVASDLETRLSGIGLTIPDMGSRSFMFIAIIVSIAGTAFQKVVVGLVWLA